MPNEESTRATTESIERKTIPNRFIARLSEIASAISEQAFDDLDAPVERVTCENAPMPYARNLEQLKVPSKAKIAAAIRKVCAG